MKAAFDEIKESELKDQIKNLSGIEDLKKYSLKGEEAPTPTMDETLAK